MQILKFEEFKENEYILFLYKYKKNYYYNILYNKNLPIEE